MKRPTLIFTVALVALEALFTRTLAELAADAGIRTAVPGNAIPSAMSAEFVQTARRELSRRRFRLDIDWGMPP